MKKLIILGMLAWFLGGCKLIPQKASIEIMSTPSAKVYINDKEAGMTPYKNSNLLPGEIDIKLTAVNQEWSKRLILQNNVNTVIDWSFDKEEKMSGGYVLYMEKTGDVKKAGLLVNAGPDKSAIHLDGEIKGFSPMRLDDIGEGDKQVTISYPAYKTLNVFVKAMKGYQLVIEATLGQQTEQLAVEEDLNKPTETPIGQKVQKAVIKTTETGWLRVRDTPSSAGVEVAKVKPGEKYTILEEKTEWIKIDLGNSKNGWISTKYAEKVLE